MPYQDGTFSNAVQNGPAQIFYPFINAATKDNVTKGTIRNYVVLPSSYTPAAALSTDPADNTQYLITESDLTIEGGVARFSRTYCKVPVDQIDYSSIVITKPAFPTNDYAGAYVESTSSTTTTNVWSATIPATFSWYPTGGTFTITYKTNTTAALNVTDSNATIDSAINGLSSVVSGGFTVYVANSMNTAGTLNIYRLSGNSFSYLDFSMNVSSVTAAVNQSRAGGTNEVYFNHARSSPNINKTSHNVSNAASIRISNNTGAGQLVIVNSVVDSNNFTFSYSASTAQSYSGYRNFLRTYTPGTDRALSKLTDKFYLPTVTPGISTAADIPVPDVAINDTQLLNLIAGSATGFQNYDAEPVTGWPSDQSPVYRQRLIQINVDNL